MPRASSPACGRERQTSIWQALSTERGVRDAENGAHLVDELRGSGEALRHLVEAHLAAGVRGHPLQLCDGSLNARNILRTAAAAGTAHVSRARARSRGAFSSISVSAAVVAGP